MSRRVSWLSGVTVLILGCAAIAYFIFPTWIGFSVAPPKAVSFEELTGSLFLGVPKEPFKTPEVRELVMPTFDNATSIWGSTGRDRRGHIWVGVSASSGGKSAHLFEYVPDVDTWHDRGSVIDQLKAVSLFSEGEGQIKIHSKIISGSDDWLYFASTDEEGESVDLDKPPRWGAHLWRIHPERHTWQHLVAVREGLVAVNGVGQYIYGLGYWDHVLYQYNTASGRAKRVVVGSTGGHVSRNFLADAHGHAYVPRLSAAPNGAVSVALVEYDENLKEIGITPLQFYLDNGSPESNHGIVGLAYLPDGRMVFTTHVGHLYIIEPHEKGPATVTAAGWFHPDGEAYAPALFSFGGSNWIAGVARRQKGFEWVVSDLSARLAAAFPIDTKGLQKVLLYGSISRDNAGRVYLGGWAEGEPGKQRPLMLQVQPGG